MSSTFDVHTPPTPYSETGKVIYALWGDGLDVALRDEGLRDALASAGATRLQVNLDDEAVAQAMRIPTGAPISGVLSVWTKPDKSAVDAATACLRRVAERVAGWAVDERRPLDHEQAPDGTRLDGLANVAVLRRPADLPEDTWRERWLVDHTEIAIETQATFGYIQNLVVRPVVEDSPVVHAIVEELFPSAGITDMHAFYGSGGDDAELEARLTRLMASVARIGADQDLDLVPTSRWLYTLTEH